MCILIFPLMTFLMQGSNTFSYLHAHMFFDSYLYIQLLHAPLIYISLLQQYHLYVFSNTVYVFIPYVSFLCHICEKLHTPLYSLTYPLIPSRVRSSFCSYANITSYLNLLFLSLSSFDKVIELLSDRSCLVILLPSKSPGPSPLSI